MSGCIKQALMAGTIYATIFILLLSLQSIAEASPVENDAVITNNLGIFKMFSVNLNRLHLELPSYITLWNITTDEDIELYLSPYTECQSVALYPVGDKVDINYVNSTIKINHYGEPTDYMIVFRPWEQSVTIFKRKYFYPLSRVHLQKSEEGFILPVWDTEKSSYAPPNILLKIPINQLLVFTSSPYCSIILTQFTKRPSYYRIMYRNATVDNFFPGLSAFSSKRNQNFIINGQLAKYKISNTDGFCNNFLLPPNLHTGYSEYLTLSKTDSKPDFIKYTFTKSARYAPIKQSINSFAIELLNPLDCPWIRICFGISKSNPICSDPPRTLDILTASRIFIPTHTDSASAINMPGSDLTRFQIIYIPEEKAVLMGYGRNTYGHSPAYTRMYLDWTYFANEVEIVLAKHHTCQARVTEDTLGSGVEITYPTNMFQSLSLTGCDMLVPA